MSNRARRRAGPTAGEAEWLPPTGRSGCACRSVCSIARPMNTRGSNCHLPTASVASRRKNVVVRSVGHDDVARLAVRADRELDVDPAFEVALAGARADRPARRRSRSSAPRPEPASPIPSRSAARSARSAPVRTPSSVAPSNASASSIQMPAASGSSASIDCAARDRNSSDSAVRARLVSS